MTTQTPPFHITYYYGYCMSLVIGVPRTFSLKSFSKGLYTNDDNTKTVQKFLSRFTSEYLENQLKQSMSNFQDPSFITDFMIKKTFPSTDFERDICRFVDISTKDIDLEASKEELEFFYNKDYDKIVESMKRFLNSKPNIRRYEYESDNEED